MSEETHLPIYTIVSPHTHLKSKKHLVVVKMSYTLFLILSMGPNVRRH